MDIKKYRREAGVERDQIDDNYRRRELAQGNAATEQNPFWWARAGSFQYGAETTYWAVEIENQEYLDKFGIPGKFTNARK